MRPDMLFGVGSITKTFVAVVILQLAEEGRLDLSATAESVLASGVDGVPNAATATIAQLLNHTGGVPSWEDDPAWIRDGRVDRLDVDRMWDKTATLAYMLTHAPMAQLRRNLALAIGTSGAPASVAALDAPWGGVTNAAFSADAAAVQDAVRWAMKRPTG